MRTFLRYYKAEFYKHRRGVFYPLHILLPFLLVIGLTLLFYNRRDQIGDMYVGTYFFEALSISLPLVIAIVCGMVCKQEEETSYQIILKAPSRMAALLGQITMLLTMCAFTFLISVCGLFVSMKYFLGIAPEHIQLFIYVIAIIFLSIIILYILNLFLGYKFGFGVCSILGFLGVVISALGMTGLGDGVWYFLPHSWAIRFTQIILLKAQNANIRLWIQRDEQIAIPVAFTFTILFLVMLLIWIVNWQGNKKE